MARRRQSFGFQGRGSRRLTEWVISSFPATVTNIPASSKVLLSSVAAAQLTALAPATIVRTRGVLMVSTDQTAALEFQLGSFGLGFVNEVARALGVTALPGPSTDALWDGWFVHQYFQQKHDVAETGPAYAQYVIDSKAMRKFEGDEGLVFMVENTHATQGFEVALGLRILMKAG